MMQISLNPLTVFVRVIRLKTLHKCQNTSGYSASRISLWALAGYFIPLLSCTLLRRGCTGVVSNVTTVCRAIGEDH